MKLFKKCTFALVMLILTVGVVCASDLNQTADIEDAGENYTKTFADLNDDISNSNDVFEVEDDYTFNFLTDFDYFNGISIDKNLIINGNDHIIDGKGQCSLLYIEDVDYLEINELTIRNCVINAIEARSSNVVFNNVKFITTDFKPTDLPFTWIYTEFSNITIKNSLFMGKYDGDGSAVKSNINSTINIENTQFLDLNSIYGGAILSQGSILSVKNSTFKNVHAKLTGGAIAAKFSEDCKNRIVIENCAFDNATSLKNGGAIFYDAKGISEKQTLIPGTMTIINSTFKNCGAEFGGAILQLNGNLTIADSNFINNSAKFYGGGVYTSLTNLSIDNSEFGDNHAGAQAAALYFDNAKLDISNSNFTRNRVNLTEDNIASAVYIYESEINIRYSRFNNTGISIYGVFTKKSVFSNNTYDIVLLNNTNDVIAISNNGITLNLINNSIVVDNLPSKFDLRDWGWVTPVKDQGQMGSCWAFSGAAAMESALFKSTGIEFDISENNIQNNELIYSIYGDTRDYEGGNGFDSLGYALSWKGIIPEDEDVYDEYGKSSMVIDSDNRIHVQDSIIIIPTEINQTIKQMKEALMKYGALSIQYYANHMEPDYNETNYAYYVNETKHSTHSVSIVGWDDNFSRNNFINDPGRDGAWIVKNSWGAEFGDKGYFYMSYYDKSLLQLDSTELFTGAVGYIFENTIPYTTNYQTDLTGLTAFNGNYSYYSNNFISLKDELIGAVGTYFNESGICYELKIYVNDELMHTQSGVSEYSGFKTIVLNNYIQIKENDKFKVEFKSNNVPSQFLSRQHIKNGVSYVSIDGENWIDYATLNKSICLKVYTLAENSRLNTSIIANSSMIVLVTDLSNGTSQFNLTLVSEGEFLANKSIAITFNGETDEFTTDGNGMISYGIPLVNAGNYSLDMEFAGDAIYNPSNASSTIKVVKEQSKIFLRNALYFVTQTKMVRVTFWDGSNNPVAGKTVHITIGNSTWSGVTDANGDAYIRVGIGFGMHDATVHFDGDDRYAASNRSGLVRVIKETPSLMVRSADTQFKVSDAAKTVKVYLWDRQSKALPANSKIAIKVNGQTYIGYTDSDGIASVSIEFNKPGTFNAEVKYAGNSAYNAVTRNVKFIIS